MDIKEDQWKDVVEEGCGDSQYRHLFQQSFIKGGQRNEAVTWAGCGG